MEPHHITFLVLFQFLLNFIQIFFTHYSFVLSLYSELALLQHPLIDQCALYIVETIGNEDLVL